MWTAGTLVISKLPEVAEVAFLLYVGEQIWVRQIPSFAVGEGDVEAWNEAIWSAILQLLSPRKPLFLVLHLSQIQGFQPPHHLVSCSLGWFDVLVWSRRSDCLMMVMVTPASRRKGEVGAVIASRDRLGSFLSTAVRGSWFVSWSRVESCLRTSMRGLDDLDPFRGRQMAVDGFDCFALIFRSEWFERAMVGRLYLEHPSFHGQGIVDGLLDHWESDDSRRYLECYGS